MPTYRDARLTNPVLLAIAAQRAWHRIAQPPASAPWWESEGLAALLQAAGQLPQRGPWDVGGLGTEGLGSLLKEPGHEA